MYCLGCLQNQKHSTESTCLARASAGAAGGLRGRGRFASMGEKIQEFSLLLSFMSLVNE